MAEISGQPLRNAPPLLAGQRPGQASLAASQGECSGSGSCASRAVILCVAPPVERGVEAKVLSDPIVPEWNAAAQEREAIAERDAGLLVFDARSIEAEDWIVSPFSAVR